MARTRKNKAASEQSLKVTKKKPSAAKRLKSKSPVDKSQDSAPFNYGNYGNYGNMQTHCMGQMGQMGATIEEGTGNGGPWVEDESVPPRILSEKRSIGRRQFAFLRKVCLFSESTGAKWWPKQFAVEKTYFNRKTQKMDVFVWSIPLDCLPGLILAATELNKVADMPHSTMMYMNPANCAPPFGETASSFNIRPTDGQCHPDEMRSNSMMKMMEGMMKKMIPAVIQNMRGGEGEEEEGGEDDDDDEEEEDEDEEEGEGGRDEYGDGLARDQDGTGGGGMMIDDADSQNEAKKMALASKVQGLIPK